MACGCTVQAESFLRCIILSFCNCLYFCSVPYLNELLSHCVCCRGVGAMEIVAMDMKLRGMYIARQLSFHGVAFKIEEVALSKEFVVVYDESVKLVS